MTQEEYLLLMRVAEQVGRIQQIVVELAQGHNGLVEILKHQGRRMATILDVLAADDAKLATLQTGIEALIAALKNPSNVLTPEAQAAADALSAHFDTVQAEVDTALPSQGGGPVTPTA